MKMKGAAVRPHPLLLTQKGELACGLGAVL